MPGKRSTTWSVTHPTSHRKQGFVRSGTIGSSTHDLSFPSSSSTDINIRAKRSKNSNGQSRRQGCSLGTCTVHDLAHRLHELNSKGRIVSAPVVKISPHGYGRRRRSLPERRVTLRLEKGTLRPAWGTNNSQVHKLEALLRRTWDGGWKRSWACVLSAPFLNSQDASDLKLLPSILQHICSRQEDWVRAEVAAAEALQADPCSSATNRPPRTAERHWSVEWTTGAALCSAERKEDCKYVVEMNSSSLWGNSPLIHFAHLFLKAKTITSAIFEGLYRHVYPPSNCQKLSALLSFGLKSNESSGKHIITLPNGLWRSHFVKFWTLYKGNALDPICASP